MYASIRRYKVKNINDFDEIIRRSQQDFVPLIKQVPGFIAYHLINTGNDTVVTFSLFHNQAGADESTRLATNWVQQNLAQYVQGPLEVTSGEVLIHEFK